MNGAPLHDENPGGAVRTLPLGRAGMVTYLILDDQRRVDVVNVVAWVDAVPLIVDDLFDVSAHPST